WHTRSNRVWSSDGCSSDLFLMLDQTPVLRWRGRCLARLGTPEAIEDLTHALVNIAPLGLVRAEAGLRTDLAMAYSVHGDLTQAQIGRAAGRDRRTGCGTRV